MASVFENLARVKSAMSNVQDFADHDHERILQDHEDAMREHERQMAQHRKHFSVAHKRRRRDERDARFRFKGGQRVTKTEKTQHGDATNTDRLDHFTAHPLSRPAPDDAGLLDPTDDSKPAPADPDSAFKTSLFDALADDEGAAAYWEAVYNQPIHVYPRPETQTEGLEAMTDDEYAAYVKHKMWERANPHLVREMRKRHQTDPNPATGGSRKRRTDHDAHVRAEMQAALERGARRKRNKQLADAHERYQRDWQALLSDKTALEAGPQTLLARLPWPLVSRLLENKTNSVVPDLSDDFVVGGIKEFFTLAGAETSSQDTLTRLKADRFRWHPDKMTHRFKNAFRAPADGGDELSAAALKAVTGVFLIVDTLFAQERLER